MEEPGICSDAGDGESSSDVMAAAPNPLRAPEADGEEISMHQSSSKQATSTSVQSDHATASAMAGIETAPHNCDENGGISRAADACNASEEDRVCQDLAGFQNISSKGQECQAVGGISDLERQDVHMVESKPDRKVAGEQHFLLASGSGEAEPLEMQYPDAGCEFADDEAGEMTDGRGFVRETCDIPQDETESQASGWSPPYEGGLRLDELHDDVILHIATFLEARDIQHTLTKVCQRFQDIFDNEAYWRTRIFLRCNKPYPAIAASDFSWVDACVAREDSYREWSDWSENTHHFMYGYNVNGEVDAVHLMKDGELMVSGDRNRFLNLVDLTKWDDSAGLKEEERSSKMLVHTDISHAGWIWSMASMGNTLITGSWDTHVRVFDVAAECALSQNFKCKSAVLSLYAEENELVASCFKEVAFFDRRSSEQKQRIYHTRPVLCVVGDEQFIITGSEDKSIQVFDRRACKIFSTLKLNTYPLCMSYHDNQLWFGDRLGQLHLYDGTGGAFNSIGTYDVSHKDKITGMVTTLGATYTCSGDKTIKVSEPTRDPGLIASLEVHKKEIAKIDYKNGVLVSAGGDECMGVWLPKTLRDYSAHHLM